MLFCQHASPVLANDRLTTFYLPLLYYFQLDDQRVAYVEEVRGAVIQRETVKKESAVLCAGVYGIVKRVILVNGETVVLEVRELCDRILEGPMCECGPVFRQLAIICRYVKCESVQLFRYSKEAEDMHVMLPDRKKAC